METKIQWNEGDGAITATYNGSGDGTVTIISDINEGIDREQTISVKTTDGSISVDVSVSQEGLREIFLPNDGNFILADGGTFNVLKPTGLPSGLTEVEYIESNGSNYIDTGIIGRSGLSCEMKMMWITAPSDTSILSSRNGTNRFYMLHYFRGWCMGYGGYYPSGVAATTNTIYEISTSLYNGSQTIVVNGEQVYSSSYETDIDTGLTMYIFGMNYNGALNYKAKARLYELTIFDNGEKIADYTPCVDSDGVYGLYNWVSESFYPLIS